MTLPDEAMEKLRELSTKATQGPYEPETPHKINPRTTVCYLHFGEPLGPRPEIDGYSDCLSLASERGLADAQFIAALVNWFRDNEPELLEMAKDAGRLYWLRQNCSTIFLNKHVWILDGGLRVHTNQINWTELDAAIDAESGKEGKCT